MYRRAIQETQTPFKVGLVAMNSYISNVKRHSLQLINKVFWPVHFRKFKSDIGGGEMPSDGLLQRLVYHWGNSGWSADFNYLKLLLRELLESKNRTVIECGSGLTSVLLGVVADLNSHKIISLEHNPEWHERISKALKSNGIRNSSVHYCPLKSYGDFDWYDISGLKLSDQENVDLVICDGPPARTRGGRVGLPYVLGSKFNKGCLIVADDAHRPAEREMLEKWILDFKMTPDIQRSMSHFRSLIVP